MNQPDGRQQILPGFLADFWGPQAGESCARQAVLPHRVSPGQAATVAFLGSMRTSEISGIPILTRIQLSPPEPESLQEAEDLGWVPKALDS